MNLHHLSGDQRIEIGLLIDPSREWENTYSEEHPWSGWDLRSHDGCFIQISWNGEHISFYDEGLNAFPVVNPDLLDKIQNYSM